MNSLTYSSRLQVVLPDPSRTLRYLCKHFSHKVSAEWDQKQGLVDFVAGTCTLRAEQQCLTLACKATNTRDLHDIEQTLERHLSHMGGSQEKPEPFLWSRSGSK